MTQYGYHPLAMKKAAKNVPGIISNHSHFTTNSFLLKKKFEDHYKTLFEKKTTM
jgi:glucuronate isomerase